MKKTITLIVIFIFSVSNLYGALPYSAHTSRETFATQLNVDDVTDEVEGRVSRPGRMGNDEERNLELLDLDSTFTMWDKTLDSNSMSDDEATNPLHFTSMKKLREKAGQFFVWVIDAGNRKLTGRENELFEICLPYIHVIFEEYGDRGDVFVTEKVRELVLDKARDQLEYFKKNHHEYKNIFRVADIDRDAVVRLTKDNELYSVSRVEEKNVPLRLDEAKYGFVIEIMNRLRTSDGRAVLEQVFDEDFAPYKEYKEQILKKLLNETQIYIIKEGLYLVPGLNDVFIHTRRSINKKIPDSEDGEYALWFGELFLRKIYEDYELEGVVRLMLSGAVRFDKTDEQVFAMGRNEAFWQEMAQVAYEIEPMEPRRPPNAQYFRIERVYRKALQLSDENLHRRGITPLLLNFLYRCYDNLEALFEQYPDADDNEMIARSWPVILHYAEELIGIDAFNKGSIKDIFRTYDVYCEKVRRFTPDGELLIPQHRASSRVPNSEELLREQPILELTMKARDPALLRRIFDEYMRWRFERIGVPHEEINAFREQHITYIMKEMHIDVVRDTNSLIPYTSTSAHARSGWTRKFDYDGKRYGVWVPELRMRVLTLAERGHEILAWILLEEAPHFSPDGEMYKSHPENVEEVFEQTSDYLKFVEHGAIFGAMMSLFYNIIAAGQKSYPDLSSTLRAHSITKTNKVEMKTLEDSVQYFLDTDLRTYLEDPLIPFEDKIKRVKQYMVTLLRDYSGTQDAPLVAFATAISNAILTYAQYYLKRRTNDIRFERGHDLVYLRSA
ncbi:hypothetical protein N9934_00540 [Desulfosarcina sp.]|nr:hypothetical protein [Desulfosarcina sp.]